MRDTDEKYLHLSPSFIDIPCLLIGSFILTTIPQCFHFFRYHASMTSAPALPNHNLLSVTVVTRSYAEFTLMVRPTPIAER
jgi:hypothetical protein